MTTFYLICFTLGLGLTLISALGASSHLHIGHVHLHLGHGHGHAHAAGAKGGGKAGVSPINGFTLAAFLCWFGGCGYLLTRGADFAFFTVLLLCGGTGLLVYLLLAIFVPSE